MNIYNHDFQDNMPKIIFNRFHQGLAPRFFTGLTNFMTLGKEAMYADGSCDPLMNLGVLGPTATQLTDLTNVSILNNNTVIQNYALYDTTASETNVFAIANADELYKITGSTHTLDTTIFGTAIAAHATHATPIGRDIIIYKVNGARYIFYAWTDNTDGDVGIITTAEASQEDDFMSTAGTNDPSGALVSTLLFTVGSLPITLEVADNDFMYIFYNNIVHKYDGTSNGGAQGTFSSTVVDLPIDWIIKDAKDAKGKMWIGAMQSASGTFVLGPDRPAGVYVWDRVSTVVKFDDMIPIKGATRLHNVFFHDGIPYCFTTASEFYGTAEITELRKYNGREFETVVQVGSGNEPARKGVFEFRGMIGWMGKDGKVYAYGTPYGQLEAGLFKFFTAAASPDNVGAVYKGHKDNYYLSYNASRGAVKLQQWQPSTDTQTSASSDWLSLVKELPAHSRITGIRILWPALGSAGADINLVLKLYVNMGTTATHSLNINYSTDGTRGWRYFPISSQTGKLDNVHAIQVGLTWPSTATAIASSIRPYRIEVLYSPQEKLL